MSLARLAPTCRPPGRPCWRGLGECEDCHPAAVSLKARTNCHESKIDVTKDSLTVTEVFRTLLVEETAPGTGESPKITPRSFTREDLAFGLEQNQFEMYYQPKIRSADRTLHGAEALLRWNHLEFGLLTPDQFLPHAEATDFIQELGAWVVRQVARFNAQIRESHPSFLGRVSLNVSPSQFNDPAYLSAVLKATERFSFPNHLLEIELTETGVLRDLTQAAELMKMIRSYGISIAIDDFGTGFSSLQILARLPISTVKLDISFIRQIVHSEVDRKIVRSLLGLCKELSLTSVAEGVEDDEQANILSDWGCDFLQGFLFSHAVPEAEFLPLIV
jgi:EAL domain-containing protein (putative c-di-GMP-specific phosphodiesterase class I)